MRHKFRIHEHFLDKYLETGKMNRACQGAGTRIRIRHIDADYAYISDFHKTLNISRLAASTSDSLSRVWNHTSPLHAHLAY